MIRSLVVALHGVGANARTMASALAPIESVADVVALDGCEPFDGGGSGRQWFSITGVTEASRPARVAAALPRLLDRLDSLARDRSVDRDALILVGFSQGAIMTLAMVAQGLHKGHSVAIAGRLAVPVLPITDGGASLLLAHDTDDQVMSPTLSDDAAARLSAAGHSVALRHTAGVGHGIGPQTTTAILDWLAATAPAPSAFPVH
jgi:phospholipase/carboxylesterase